MKGMRNRTHRWAGFQQPCAVIESPTSDVNDVAPQEKLSPEVKTEGRRSWMSIIKDIAQLALDLIRVAREGTDLYRKIRFEK